jgi:Ni,Fe-hydrogenase I large subunit
MTTGKKVNSFISQVIARMKGDTPKATAEKNYRTADAALSSQIASLKADAVKKENAVEDAEEKLTAAKYPTDAITDTEAYIGNIVRAQEALTTAEKALEATNKSMEYFTKMKAENDGEIVDASTEEN